MFDPKLLANVEAQFKCDFNGYHGIGHWACVYMNAKNIMRSMKDAGLTPDEHVVSLFALLHDAARIDEGEDPAHGLRSANLASMLRRKKLFTVTQDQMDKLFWAIRYHPEGMTSEDPTVAACWDADRLDLFRVGITPQARYFSAPPHSCSNGMVLGGAKINSVMLIDAIRDHRESA